MKHPGLPRWYAVPAALVFAASAHAGTVSVNVLNVSNGKGMVTAALCDKSTFLKRCALVQSQPASAGLVMLSFPNVLPGRYAVSVYHDENTNRKLDRNLIGIPSEGYGFSRDAPIRMGPPSFDDAVFETGPDDFKLAISLRY